MKADSKTLLRKARNIKMLLLDVDGVLTDGKLVYNSGGIELKMFDVKDGYGLVRLRKAGIRTGIITAKTSAIVKKRSKDLGMDALYQNVDDKLTAYNDVKRRFRLKDGEIAYIGDDLPDLPVLLQTGLPLAVRNAADAVKKASLYVTRKDGGNGAVREIAEIIMRAKGIPMT